MRILIEAYACCPGRGSEEGNGWFLPLELARLGHTVYVFTRADNVGANESARNLILSQEPNLVGRWNIHYVEAPRWPLALPNELAHRLRYLLWLERVPSAAAGVAKSCDMAWHITWGSLACGTRLACLGLPVVHGPCGGGQIADRRTLPQFGDRIGEELRRSVAVRFFSHLRPIWLKQASLVICSNRETMRMVSYMGARRTALCSDAALPSTFRPDVYPERQGRPEFRLLWIGRLLRIKAVLLAVQIIEALPPDMPVRLDVVGDGPDGELLRKRLRTSPAASRINWIGSIPWRDVPDRLRQADAMLFTSLRDSCAAQVFEAMCWGLPVIALHQFGVRDHANRTGVCWIRPGAPQVMVRDFAHAIILLQRAPALRRRMGESNYLASAAYLWPVRARRLADLVTSVLTRRPSNLST